MIGKQNTSTENDKGQSIGFLPWTVYSLNFSERLIFNSIFQSLKSKPEMLPPTLTATVPSTICCQLIQYCYVMGKIKINIYTIYLKTAHTFYKH
jgi:hypothetical protein